MIKIDISLLEISEKATGLMCFPTFWQWPTGGAAAAPAEMNWYEQEEDWGLVRADVDVDQKENWVPHWCILVHLAFFSKTEVNQVYNMIHWFFCVQDQSFSCFVDQLGVFIFGLVSVHQGRI